MKIILNVIARVLARPAVADYLIRRAKKTPYFNLVDPDGSVYMERYWLFNPYKEGDDKNRFPLSIRLHRIMRPDNDRHMHDHPWNARTFILRGWYQEVRQAETQDEQNEVGAFGANGIVFNRIAGNTAALRFGQYHRITQVSIGGVWTVFVTSRYQGTWGFLVNGIKIPWRQYLAKK